jgi:hypothetical protein
MEVQDFAPFAVKESTFLQLSKTEPKNIMKI